MTRASLFATFFLFAAQASAWWAPEWTARKTIGINTTAAGMNLQQPAADVPVLLRLHGGNFPQFLNAKEGGADFRFVAADDKTPLKYHIEKFDAASQIALIWVKVPTLKPQSVDNKIYLYFANQAASLFTRQTVGGSDVEALMRQLGPLVNENTKRVARETLPDQALALAVVLASPGMMRK